MDLSNITGIITETSIGEYLDLSGTLQYIKLGTEIYNRIADLVVKNDPLWGEQFVFKADHLGGGGPAALKKGMYVLVATTDFRAESKKKWADDYSNVFYKGKHLHLEQEENHLKTNYLVFSLDFS